MKTALIITMILLTGIVKAQFPFENYPAMNYSKKANWTFYDKWEKEKKLHWTMTFPDFFNIKDSLTVQLSSFRGKDTSYIRIFKNKTQIQLIKEPYSIGLNFGMLIDTVYYGDVNGDSLLDLKILCWYGGCGVASFNERVIYLIQGPDNKFTKFSYIDMASSGRLERDLDGDGNFEIITMTLNHYKNHNYWTFNLYNFINGDLVCVNDKFDYPIMIQYLYRMNYKVTDKITKAIMKTFSLDKPDSYDKR